MLLRRCQPERRHGRGPPRRHGLRLHPHEPAQDLRHASRRRRSRRGRRGLQIVPVRISAEIRPDGRPRPPAGPRLCRELPGGGEGPDLHHDPGPGGHPRGRPERGAERQLSDAKDPGHLRARFRPHLHARVRAGPQRVQEGDRGIRPGCGQVPH